MFAIRFLQCGSLLRLMFLLLSVLLRPVHAAEPVAIQDLVELGKSLFFDVNLSLQRTQACATCHMPARAFVDVRNNAADGAVSMGDDGTSLGVRNTPTLAYIALTPDFHRDDNGDYKGGFFLDGRAATLPEQAREPLLNPIEMALTDAAMVSARIQENATYVAAFAKLFSPSLFTSDSAVHAAVGTALAAFEQTREFAPFDSRYDRALRGEYTMSAAEERGRNLFFSSLINCSNCHKLDSSTQETFTDYSYHNIGVPANPAVERQGTGTLPDPGLSDNPAVLDSLQRGRFKVPTLRNVAVTGPYMHNGVFNELRTVLEFYNKYIIVADTNPETGKSWGEPEADKNISTDLLSQGQPLNDYHLEALEAFLRTLTDRRYEYLLEE